MQTTKLLLTIALLLLTTWITQAQNNTNSPYTRYGYGKLADQSVGSQRGMGGIGVGLRNSKIINPLNPASYSAVDSMTFMFDVGVKGQMAWFEEGGKKSRKENGSLEYLSLQLPLAKKLGLGVGFVPVSYVGYNYGGTDVIFGDETVQTGSSGSGGFQKLYGSLSYDFFDRLSVGVNVGYLFGDIYNDLAITFDNSDYYTILYSDTLRASGLVYEAGLQYHQPIGKDKSLVIGAVYAPKTKFTGTVRTGDMRLNSSSLVMSSENYSSRDSVFEMPQKIAFGATFNKLNHYTIGADVQIQQWSDAKFYNKTDSLRNDLKINVGGEYIPNFKANNFLKRTRYRIGAYYSDSYVQLGGKGYKEYGATIGFGFPTSDRRSVFNIAFDYTTIRPEVSSIPAQNMKFVSEKYFKVTISYTFNESWFYKRKIQ